MIDLVRKRGYVILTDGQSTISLSVEDAIHAHGLLAEYLQEKGLVEMIGTVQAQNIAADAGYDIPITTLVNTCARDGILGARKRDKRWQMPRQSFDQWFAEWKARQSLRS